MMFFDFRYVAQQWASIGMFDIVLPFLIIFALVYAIFERTKLLGENIGVRTIISLAIALFTIGNPYVSNVFLPLFSNVGLGLAILVGLLILVGLFIRGDENWFKILGSIFAAGIFFWVLSRAFSPFYGSWGWQNFWYAYGPLVIFGIMIIGGILFVILARSKTHQAPQQGR